MASAHELRGWLGNSIEPQRPRRTRRTAESCSSRPIHRHHKYDAVFVLVAIGVAFSVSSASSAVKLPLTCTTSIAVAPRPQDACRPVEPPNGLVVKLPVGQIRRLSEGI